MLYTIANILDAVNLNPAKLWYFGSGSHENTIKLLNYMEPIYDKALFGGNCYWSNDQNKLHVSGLFSHKMIQVSPFPLTCMHTKGVQDSSSYMPAEIPSKYLTKVCAD